MDNTLLYLIGWRALILHGDPLVVDRWKWLKKHLRPGPLRTLDAGCGNGAFTMFASRIGNCSLGVSFDEPANRKCRSRASLLGIANVEFISADLRKIDELANVLGSFDQIVCLETIEHIRNDCKLVADLADLLKPGGRLLLTTPYKHYRHLFGETISEDEDGGHVRWGYTHEEIQVLFRKCGLEVEVKEFLCGFISQTITNVMRILDRVNARLSWAFTLPMRPLKIIDPFLTSLMGYPYMTIGVVGVKRG